MHWRQAGDAGSSPASDLIPLSLSFQYYFMSPLHCKYLAISRFCIKQAFSFVPTQMQASSCPKYYGDWLESSLYTRRDSLPKKRNSMKVNLLILKFFQMTFFILGNKREGILRNC